MTAPILIEGVSSGGVYPAAGVTWAEAAAAQIERATASVAIRTKEASLSSTPHGHQPVKLGPYGSEWICRGYFARVTSSLNRSSAPRAIGVASPAGRRAPLRTNSVTGTTSVV